MVSYLEDLSLTEKCLPKARDQKLRWQAKAEFEPNVNYILEINLCSKKLPPPTFYIVVSEI